MGLVENLLNAIIEHEHERQKGVEDNRYVFFKGEETRNDITILGKADFSKGHQELDYVLEFEFSPEPDFRSFSNGYSGAQLERICLMLKAFGLGTLITLDITKPYAFFYTITLDRGHQTKEHQTKEHITSYKKGFSMRLSLEEVSRLEHPTEYGHIKGGLSGLIDLYITSISENRKARSFPLPFYFLLCSK